MRRRDETEFTEFVVVAARRMRRTAYLMCGDRHQAEDAVQDALVRIYRRWSHLRRSEGLMGYAHRAVVTAVLDQSRRRWRREVVREVDAIVVTEPYDAVAVVDNRAVVVQALSALPARQRACVVLRYYADFSIEQTADALGIGAGSVKSQTSRGLAQLRGMLAVSERNTT
ncbi:SigE family RNA polymerase sigma factor [Kribbella sp. NPDC055071]